MDLTPPLTKEVLKMRLERMGGKLVIRPPFADISYGGPWNLAGPT